MSDIAERHTVEGSSRTLKTTKVGSKLYIQWEREGVEAEIITAWSSLEVFGMLAPLQTIFEKSAVMLPPEELVVK